MRKKTQAERLSEKIEALNSLRNLCPRGSRVHIKFIRAYRDINGNTNRVVSYFISWGGEVYCIDGYIACYYDTRVMRSNTLGSGVKVRGDGTEEVNRISFDLYESLSAIKTYTMG